MFNQPPALPPPPPQILPPPPPILPGTVAAPAAIPALPPPLPPPGLATLTRQRKHGVISVLRRNDATILFSRRHEKYLCSVMLPYAASAAHVILSLSKAGTLSKVKRVFAPEDNPQESHVSMRHFSSAPKLRSHKMILAVAPPNTDGETRVVLSFGIPDLEFGSHQAKQGQVFRLSITFVVFAAPNAAVGPNQRMQNVQTSCLFRLARTCREAAEVNAVPLLLLHLPVVVYDRVGGGRVNELLSLVRNEEIPVEFAELAVREQMKFEHDERIYVEAIRVCFEAVAGSQEGEEEGEVGVLSVKDGEDPILGEEDKKLSQLLSRFPLKYGRDLLSMSYVHSDSESLWPVPVVVSSPKGNFTMGTTESGRVIPMIRSKNICSVTELNDGTGRSLFFGRSHGGKVTESRILSSGLTVPDENTLKQREREFVENSRRRHPQHSLWVLKEIVGIGGFGIVFAAVDKTRQQDRYDECVCKTSMPEAGLYGREILLREGKTLAELNTLVDCFLLNGHLHLVMRRFELWTEQKFVVNPLHSIEKLIALEKLSLGLAYCHSLEFAHCDLKPDNILADRVDDVRSLVVRLCDFGFAVRLRKGESAHGGTLGYMPPSLEGDPRKIDVYSFGIIAWELWTGKRAFQSERERFLRSCCDENEQREGAIQFLVATRGKSPDLRCLECATMPEEMQLLLARCWVGDPDERPEMNEICRVFKRLHPVALQSLIVSDCELRVSAPQRAGVCFDVADRRVGYCTFLEAVSLFNELLEEGHLSSVMKCLQHIHDEPYMILRCLNQLSVPQDRTAICGTGPTSHTSPLDRLTHTKANPEVRRE